MIRKIAFSLLWSVALCFGTAIALGLISGLLFAGLAIAGVQQNRTDAIVNVLGHMGAYLPMGLGLVGLILGICGKLPGTRRTSAAADLGEHDESMDHCLPSLPMVRKIVFVLGWSVLFFYGSAFALGFVWALLASGPGAAGVAGTQSGFVTTAGGYLFLLLPVVFGLAGLVLGILGELPGTRVEPALTDRRQDRDNGN